MIDAPRMISAAGASARGLGDTLDVRSGGRVRLGDDDDVGHAQHSLPRMMRGLVAGPQRVNQNDVEARPYEREIIVSTIPQDDVRFLLGAIEDAGIVGSRIDQVADRQVRLILLALLYGALRFIEVGQGLEPLDRLPLQVAVGHRMADRHDAKATVLELP
jgi:hypothetical protein